MRPSCALPACPGANRTGNLQAKLVLVILQCGLAYVGIQQSNTHRGPLPITGSSSMGDVGRITLSLLVTMRSTVKALAFMGPGVLVAADSLPGRVFSLPFLSWYSDRHPSVPSPVRDGICVSSHLIASRVLRREKRV